MGISIAVANADGQRIGDGPINDVTAYSHTSKLSAAGDVAVSVPATHPRAGLIYEYCRLLIDADYSGGGRKASAVAIVDKIEQAAGNGETLTASGGDLLRELQFTIANGLFIHEIATVPASAVQVINPGISTTQLTLPQSVVLGPDGWLYVLRPYPFTRMEFDISSATAGSSGGEWQAFVEGDGWIYPHVHTNTTASMTQSGVVEWDQPDGVTQAAHEDGNLYAMRLIWTDSYATGPTLTIGEVLTRGVNATDQGFQQVLALADGWELSENWHDSTSTATVMDCGNNSLLWCLTELTKRTGDQWRLAPDGSKTIELLCQDSPDSGLTAIGWASSATASNSDLCFIEEGTLRRLEDATTRVTRVYPYGAGSGDGRLTLDAASVEMPPGYSINRGGNYIERVLPAGEQRIEAEIVFREIQSVGGALAAKDELAANQLAMAALNHLRLHDGNVQYFAFELTVVGAHKQIRVGETIRVAYKDNGIDLDTRLLILEATETDTVGDTVSVKLKVATLARWPRTAADILAGKIGQLIASSGYQQPLPKAALQGNLRGSDIVAQIITSSGGRPTADPMSSQSVAAALVALGLINTE